MDLGPIQARLFSGERWPSYAAPLIPHVNDLKRAVASIATDPASGRPIFRLDWLPDVTVIRQGERIHAYLIHAERVPNQIETVSRIFLADGSYKDLASVKDEIVTILLPRWGVRQLVPDAAGKPEWEQTKTRMAGYRGAEFAESYLGPYPETGLYRELPGDWGVIAEHLPGHICCQMRGAGQIEGAEGLVCYGKYKAPDWWLIDGLKEKWQQVLREPYYREAHEAPDEREVAAFARKIADEQQARRDEMKAARREAVRESVKRDFDVFSDVGAAHRKREKESAA